MSSTCLLQLCACCRIFGSLEALLARQFDGGSGSGDRGDWQELEGCWVLRPPGKININSTELVVVTALVFLHLQFAVK